MHPLADVCDADLQACLVVMLTALQLKLSLPWLQAGFTQSHMHCHTGGMTAHHLPKDQSNRFQVTVVNTSSYRQGAGSDPRLFRDVPVKFEAESLLLMLYKPSCRVSRSGPAQRYESCSCEACMLPALPACLLASKQEWSTWVLAPELKSEVKKHRHRGTRAECLGALVAHTR